MKHLVSQAGRSDGMRRGIYETEWGNAAYVSGPNAKTAYDLDAAERIPMTCVTAKRLRDAEPFDAQASGRGGTTKMAANTRRLTSVEQDAIAALYVVIWYCMCSDGHINITSAYVYARMAARIALGMPEGRR